MHRAKGDRLVRASGLPVRQCDYDIHLALKKQWRNVSEKALENLNNIISKLTLIPR